MARHTLGICYASKKDPDLVRVIEIANELAKTKSEIGRKLINRGLAHTDNPTPLFPSTKAESLAKATIRERKQVVRPAKESVESVSGEQSQLRPSGDKLSPGNKADRKSDSASALDKKKSPVKGQSNAGWIALGLLGVGVVTWLAVKFG